MASKVGIGIIGTGFARKVQIPGFLACEGAEIVSVASGSYENARSTAEEFGIEHYTADWRETVAHRNVDLVCITTPPNLHREMTTFALDQHKHVLCEKPMAMNVAEAEQMTAAAGRKDVLALIDHELRFQPGRLHAYQMLRDGAIGKVIHAKYTFRAQYRGDASVPWNWWSDEEQGGGALGAIGSHAVDSFNWFLGTTVSSVFCQLQTHVKRRQDPRGHIRDVTSDDEAMMVLRFADSELAQDATGVISLSMAEWPEYQNRIEIFGTKGAMRVNHRGELFVGQDVGTGWQEVDVDLGQPVDGPADTGFSRGFMSFAPKIVEAIRTGSNSVDGAATFEDGLKVQRVLDASRKSNASGCVVRVR